MELLKVKDFIIDYIENEKHNLVNRKNNINHNYAIAKHDFRVIENMEDVIETLQYCVDKINDLQERIIERNNCDLSNIWKDNIDDNI